MVLQPEQPEKNQKTQPETEEIWKTPKTAGASRPEAWQNQKMSARPWKPLQRNGNGKPKTSTRKPETSNRTRENATENIDPTSGP